MVPFDVPHVAHDMMLRFMGVNFTAIIDGSARIPSTIGNTAKPLFVEEHDATPVVPPAKTPQQDKAMWEGSFSFSWQVMCKLTFFQAYYNAGSAALVLVVVFLIIGTFIWCRLRRRRVQLPITRTEENIPLTSSLRENGLDEDDNSSRKRKGKAREESEPLADPPIFEVGDSDEEEYHSSSAAAKR